VTRIRKILGSVLVVAVVASITGGATFAKFTSTSASSANSFSAGTVYVQDDDAGGVLWNVSNQGPSSAAVVKCIRVTYSGSLDSTVKLYASNASGTVDQYLNLTIEKGTMPGTTTFPSCTSFSAQSTIFTGTLDAFKTNNTNFANGISSFPGAATKWTTSDSVVYRFTISVQNAAYGAQGLTSTAGFTWEAQNQ
jgi:predicted ribosomally synthesized peptide with SipW-like signal peptide